MVGIAVEVVESKAKTAIMVIPICMVCLHGKRCVVFGPSSGLRKYNST